MDRRGAVATGRKAQAHSGTERVLSPVAKCFDTKTQKPKHPWPDFPIRPKMELFSRKCRTPRDGARLMSALVWAGLASFGMVIAHGLEPAAVPQRFGNVPLMFEPLGATEAGTLGYLGRGPGYRVRVGPTQLDVEVQVAEGRGDKFEPSRGGARSRHVAPKANWLSFGMELVGSDAKAGVIAEQDLPTRVNYFVGNDPRAWRTGVATHARVRYQAVYPGIDLVYYGNQRQLEHDFVVAPGADPARILWRFEGTDDLELRPDGGLTVSVGSASLEFRPPHVYQWHGGERQVVPAAYKLEPGSAEVGFAVAPYDPTRTLVIDPVLVYSTFLGGLGYEQASGVAVNSEGQAYVVGETSSTNFPVANALWGTNAGGYDGIRNPYGNEAFVAKLGAQGTNLIFATYFGGDGVDAAIAVALDPEGNPVITGLTGSTNFPVTPNALQSRIAGESNLGLFLNDVFVVSISAEGDVLLYSSYIGGSDDDLGLAIACDATGAVYVAGDTESNDFPVRNNTTEYSDRTDAFVLKFRPGDPELTYSMLLGGAGFDFAQSIAVDALGHAHVVGSTGSSGFPSTNAFQAAFRGGNYDAFLTKVSPQGDGLLFSTFLGGGNQDEGFGVALDASANVFVTGYTGSGNFPVTNALYATKAPNRDAFVAKFDSTGQIHYATFLGGRSDDEGWAIAVDPAGSALVAGMTQSSDFPLTNALQTVYQGNRDVFITKFSPNGQALVFSTFLGGPRADEARALALDPAGSAYVVGYTSSTNFPVAPAVLPLQRIYGGGIADAFVLKVVPSVYLTVSRSSTGEVVLSWPAGVTDYTLEALPVLGENEEWTRVAGDSSGSNGLQSVTVTNLSAQQYYRLRQTDE
jgi:hypothetical protein